jgi:hypothetical protein
VNPEAQNDENKFQAHRDMRRTESALLSGSPRGSVGPGTTQNVPNDSVVIWTSVSS